MLIDRRGKHSFRQLNGPVERQMRENARAFVAKRYRITAPQFQRRVSLFPRDVREVRKRESVRVLCFVFFFFF